MKLRLFALVGVVFAAGLSRPTALYAADAPPVPAKQVAALPFPEGTPPSPALSVDELTAAVNRLEGALGGYPPHLRDEADRKETYTAWSPLVLSAQALRQTKGDTEPVLLALARLYRQGHNLDVTGAAQHAIEVFHAAQRSYPDSVPMLWQASYFFLQLNPKYAPQGEKALLKLRVLLHTDEHPEIERGLLFAYLYENRLPEARKQAEKCVRLSPKDETFKQILESLRAGNVERKQQ